MNIATRSRVGRLWLTWRLLPLLSVWAAPALGLENIRNVHWDYQPSIAWSPDDSPLRLSFDADLTPLEVTFPITSFAIALVYPEGTPVVLYRYSCGPFPSGTPAGIEARFTVQLDMRCDPLHGDIEVRNVSSSMYYRHPTIGERTGGIQVEHRNAYGSVRQSLGIALLDQNGNIVAQSLPSDTFTCSEDHAANQFNGALGVYFDAEGTSCQGTIPAGSVGKVYVFATLGGTTAGGLAGAEFRFSGMPAAWEAYAVPSADILSLGDPFDDGVVAGFPCKQSSNGKVLLYTVVVIAHEEVTDIRFDLELRHPPLSYTCPLVLACDEPVFTKYCVETSSCYINAIRSTPCATPLAVEQVTWSQLKEFYR